MIRPFFQSNGIAWQQAHSHIENQRKNESGSDQVDSSEGFTSFFTTTNSGTNSGGTTHSGSPQSSDLDKKPRAMNTSRNEKENDNGDDASMVVLARVKRKHKKAEDSGNSASSGEKRVRIQDRTEKQRGQEQVYAACEANGGSSGSSSLSNAPNQEEQQPRPDPLHISVPSRVVTDASSSKMSSATSSNVNTSGSGSGGNTGSGSNQGSSGSGNEGKASSEEPVRGDNGGDSPVDLTDQSFKKPVHASDYEPRYDEANREKKLLDKKRKRIEMRREYEAQQQMESSESSDPSVALVRPGKPVTMDQVLRFSKIAR